VQGAMETTSSSLEALGREYQAIAHNLANANTVGYKRRQSSFALVLAERLGGASVVTDVSRLTGGSVQGSLQVDFAEGRMVRTSRPLDLALHGRGFFVVETPQGPLYTRNGVFRTNAQGQLVDASGRTVAGEGGPITIPTGVSSRSVNVATDGSISAGGNSIGKLRVVEFEDPTLLVPAGRNCFRAPAGTQPNPAAGTTVHQGFQEASNVNVVEELVGLITIGRLYEANLKAVTSQDERLKSLLQVALS